MNAFISFLLNEINRKSAVALGRGFGSSSIKTEVKSVRKLLLEPPRLAIDIGGNIGRYSEELLAVYPEIELHIFEPSLTNVKNLNEKFEKKSNVSIVPFAVSNKYATVQLFSNETGSGLASLIKRDLGHINLEFNSIEWVEAMPFEDYWKSKLQSRNIDFVKLDIEGHELTALEGFGNAIDSVNLIQFEFGGCNIDSRTFFRDFWRFFIRIILRSGALVLLVLSK